MLRILSGASAIIAEGEVHQLTAQRRIETDEDRYLAIIGAKTAASVRRRVPHRRGRRRAR